MATSVAAVSSAGGTFVPSLENHFGLSIGNEVHSQSTGIVVWQNPHLGSAITPYIPSEADGTLLATCLAAFKNKNNHQALGQLSAGEWLFLNHDVSAIILCQLDLKSVINFSKANKCMYLAAKQDFVWQKQLPNLLPSVSVIPSDLCSFSPQQQFQIIYKRIKDESKPYQAVIDHALSLIKDIFSQMGLTNIEPNMQTSPDLVRIDNAIKVLIPAEFNNQEKFEEVIRKAEVIKNTAPSSSSVTVEDVTDVAESSKENGA